MKRVQDRIAVVTGAGSGIGQAIAILFAQEGASVVVADRIAASAGDTVQQIVDAGGNALAVQVDVSQAKAVAALADATVASYGRVDIVVNNAAIAEGDDILTLDEATWDRNLDIVLKSVYLCSKALLPPMIAQKRGAIVNIASVNGLTGIGEEAYSAAKAGVINLTKNMAVKYGQHNVRVNVICPGTVYTPIWRPILAKDPRVFEKLSRWYPLGRVGQPDDIARAALYLASDEAAWVTGATLVVDGGLTAGNNRIAQELMGDG
jgi:meso-butanediol dehydrogenase/(S,S)-butanediol dehydrogenase/diacetyl reductase